VQLKSQQCICVTVELCWCWMKELSSLEEKMEYQLEERTRDMQDMLESCQTKVCLCVSSVLLSPGTSQGPCCANLHKWDLTQSPSCDCGQRQTLNHIVNSDMCLLTKFEGGSRVESTPRSGWWRSHMAGIYSNCSTCKITSVIQAIVVDDSVHMYIWSWVSLKLLLYCTNVCDVTRSHDLLLWPVVCSICSVSASSGR